MLIQKNIPNIYDFIILTDPVILVFELKQEDIGKLRSRKRETKNYDDEKATQDNE